MSAQPEALRLADELERYHGEYPTCTESAAELRRLSAVEADFHMAYRMKCDKQTKVLHAQRDALLEALKEAAEALEIAADNGGVNFYQYAKEARAAIVAATEREACAKVCEQMPELEHGWRVNLPNDCAAAIRARSNT